MGEKKIIAELKRCLCEAQGRVVRYTMMDNGDLARYRMSEGERALHKARATGERNAFRKALKIMGVREGDIQELIDAVKVQSKGDTDG